MSNSAALLAHGTHIPARRFVKTPKGLLIIVLLVLSAIATVGKGPALVAPELAVAVFVAMLLDLAILRIRKKRWVFPDGALLSGLIVALILAPEEPLYVVALTSAIAIASKYILRIGPANILNPAALALLVSYFLFDTAQSWWGTLAELPIAFVAALIAGGAFIVVRVNKIPVVLSFLGSYYLLVTLAAFAADPVNVAGLYRAPDLHAALFFAFFMVSDPPTSPPRSRDQIVYGIIVALIAFATYELVGAVYYLLAGLLVANVWEAWRRWREHRKKKGRIKVEHGFSPARE